MENITSLDENEDSLTLTLVSNDNQEFEIEPKFCNISLYLNGLIQMDTTVEKIPINTSGSLLNIIIKFLKYYPKHEFHRIQKPVPKDFKNSKFIHDEKENVFEESFYTSMMMKPNIDLIKLVHIVNYLGIQPMLELVCARIACIVRDMTKEEEMRFLNIDEEQYVEMKKTNDWAKN